MLETIWGRLRGHHADLPRARIAITPRATPVAHDQSRLLRDDDGVVTGPVVGTTTLRVGPDAVLCYVHHEAAHVLAWVRGISDTAQRGHYHNQRFKALAEETGFVWPPGAEYAKNRGWVLPPLPAEVLSRYDDLRADLERAIETTLLYMDVPSSASSSRPTKQERIAIECMCEPPRNARMGRTVLALGPVTCGVCGKDFRERK